MEMTKHIVNVGNKICLLFSQKLFPLGPMLYNIFCSFVKTVAIHPLTPCILCQVISINYKKWNSSSFSFSYIDLIGYYYKKKKEIKKSVTITTTSMVENENLIVFLWLKFLILTVIVMCFTYFSFLSWYQVYFVLSLSE